MRQFIVSSVPDKNGIISVSGKDFRYLRQVLRVKIGDMINVRLSDGTLSNTTVCNILENQKQIQLQICQKGSADESVTRGVQAEQIVSSNSSIEYWLFQFIPKASKMEQIIRQATECGIKNIVPVIGEYSQKNNVLAMESSKKDRFLRIVREARQQSGSPVETTILDAVSLKEAISLWNEETLDDGEKAAVVLWECCEQTKTVHEVLSKSDIKKVAIVVGSEGGISPSEIQELSLNGFIPIHFDTNILRCETAALYGIAAVQCALLENKKWEFKE
ncbi:MAG: 16S rRNA (uracil(1498)-N(3))-methyltransferase [Treponema sp.]|nr:16S rRNA (uracil(1498)-N(3))-methyltransferase [Treponema sp.]